MDRASAVRGLADLGRVTALASAVGAFFLFVLEGGVKFTDASGSLVAGLGLVAWAARHRRGEREIGRDPDVVAG